ncbi:MAG: hypothetical protein C0481_02990 [Phenylobacterium sp.]|uniref:hypothetical protein n=1 Tax=Phenylobacterium sp. TaxID=1871053 RepID=UPI0025D1923A|nr:hypothetical protein [Phenylobacterium sp.]MBA4010810.1 hypothetical protein [Phenylobacterium sp.]
MDFMKILRSFEDFLFEATSWLAFYPLTLWRVITRPLTWMAYSDAEQSDEGEGRYDRALSPPLLLLITVVLLNLIGTATHSTPESPSEVVKAINSTPENQALARALIFSLLPLVAAIVMLKARRQALSREALRAPFYAQCYLAAPCALILNAGIFIFAHDELSNDLGIAVMVGGAAWFLVAQTRWFSAKLTAGVATGAACAVGSILMAVACLLAILIPIALL